MPPVFDFKAAVASRFSDRPTLRQVASRQILALLQLHHPALSRVEPALVNADSLQLLTPHPSEPHWTRQALVDAVLRKILDGSELTTAPVNGRYYGVTLAPPHRFAGSDDDHEYLQLAERDFDGLLEALPMHWSQAQVDYWCADIEPGVSRDAWLQLQLKQALLRNLPLQLLDAQERDCVLGLLGSAGGQPAVFAVELEWQQDARVYHEIQPCLLLLGEWDERQVVLRCAPSGIVSRFDSLDDFALALRDELAERHAFTHLTWHRYPLEGNIFAEQTALLLENSLARVQAIPYRQLADVEALEQTYAASSDPSCWFVDGYCVANDAQLPMPPGLQAGPAVTRFAYQGALFDLALDQAQSGGERALEGIADLREYTRAQLREALLQAYPDQPIDDSDDVMLDLNVAAGVPGGAAVGTGGGEPLVPVKAISLSEFAIGNLGALQGAVIAGIHYRDGSSNLPEWGADELRALVTRVDIGGNYPTYVATAMDDPSTRAKRVRYFAREWRQTLLFSALSARLDGRLSDAQLAAVSLCCRAPGGQAQACSILPLAFTTHGAGKRYDQVMGMYIVFCASPAAVLLYRPLYGQDALMAFPSLAALEAEVRQSAPLRESVLCWMSEQAQMFYHSDLSADSRLLHLGIDPLLLPEPAKLALRLWRVDVDERLYLANRDWLVELARRTATSSAQSWWSMLGRAAWLLFQTFTPLLRGPVALVAWLAQSIVALRGDLSAVQEGNEFERSAAVVDLVLNAGMALLHGGLPTLKVGLPSTPLIHAGSPQAFQVIPEQGKVGIPGGTDAWQTQRLDFSWRGNQGLNWLTSQQRQRLSSLRSEVLVNGLQPLETGPARGLYAVDGQYYATLEGSVFLVRLLDEEVRVVGPLGDFGPWLSWSDDAWRIDGGLKLRGGMPRERLQAMRAAKAERFEDLYQQYRDLAVRNNTLSTEEGRYCKLLDTTEQRLQALQAVVEPNESTIQALEQTRTAVSLAREKVVQVQERAIENAKAYLSVVTEIVDLNVYGHVAVRGAAQATELRTTSRLYTEQRDPMYQDLIKEYAEYDQQMTRLIESQVLDELSRGIVGRPRSPEEIQRYVHFKTVQERVLPWSSRLLRMSREFDDHLARALRDDSILFKDRAGVRISKDAELRRLDGLRHWSTREQGFRLLFDLAEASIDRLGGSDGDTPGQYFEYLGNDGLKSATLTHGYLLDSDGSLSERIDALSEVLDVYEQAAVMSAYLKRFGGPVIRQGWLLEYQQVLENVTASAKLELAQAIRERELQMAPPPRVSMPARHAARRLVKSAHGRAVVGEQAQVDGIWQVQQTDPRTHAVIKTLHQRGGEWLEEAAVSQARPRPDNLDLPALRRRAQALIDQVDEVTRLADRYARQDEPLGLATVLEQQVDKLQACQIELPRQGRDEILQRGLADAIERLQATRRDRLTTLYLERPHPTAQGLRFLFEQQQVAIRRVGERKALSAGDYLDVYEVRRVSAPGRPGSGLWEAHFHYDSATAPARQFLKGHLKLWSQRKLGRKAQLAAAASGNELLAIYRGELRLEQVEGVIPFDE